MRVSSKSIFMSSSSNGWSLSLSFDGNHGSYIKRIVFRAGSKDDGRLIQDFGGYGDGDPDDDADANGNKEERWKEKKEIEMILAPWLYNGP